VRWGDAQVPAFSWFFETKRETLAQEIAYSKEVIYVPLAEAEHPSFRYFTTTSHPHIRSFSSYFGQSGSLKLPAGRFLIPPLLSDSTTFAAFMPDGTLVLLPRFDDDILRKIRAAAQATHRNRTLTDP